jgi:hypothetical protein
MTQEEEIEFLKLKLKNANQEIELLKLKLRDKQQPTPIPSTPFTDQNYYHPPYYLQPYVPGLSPDRFIVWCTNKSNPNICTIS